MNGTQRLDLTKAGYLLADAAERIEAAVRIIVAESAKAEHLTRDMTRGDWRIQQTPALEALSTQDWTELATKLGEHRNQVAIYGHWLSGPEGTPS